MLWRRDPGKVMLLPWRGHLQNAPLPPVWLSEKQLLDSQGLNSGMGSFCFFSHRGCYTERNGLNCQDCLLQPYARPKPRCLQGNRKYRREPQQLFDPRKAIARPPAGRHRLWEAVWGCSRACKPSRIQRNQARWSQDHWEGMGRGSSSATPCLIKLIHVLPSITADKHRRGCASPLCEKQNTDLPTHTLESWPWRRDRTVCTGLVALSPLLIEKALYSKDVGCTCMRVPSTELEVVDPVLQDDIIKVD